MKSFNLTIINVDNNVTITEHLITNQALVDEVMREYGEEVLSEREDNETDTSKCGT